MNLGNPGQRVKEAVVGIIRGAGDILESTVQETQEATVAALQGAGEVAKTASRAGADVVTGAIEAASEVGGGVGTVAKGAVIGVVKGVGEVATVTVGVLSDIVRAAIKGTGEVGEDVAEGDQVRQTGYIPAGAMPSPHLGHVREVPATDSRANSFIHRSEPHGHFASQRQARAAYSRAVNLWKLLKIVHAADQVPQALAGQSAARFIDFVPRHRRGNGDVAFGSQDSGETVISPVILVGAARDNVWVVHAVHLAAVAAHAHDGGQRALKPPRERQQRLDAPSGRGVELKHLDGEPILLVGRYLLGLKGNWYAPGRQIIYLQYTNQLSPQILLPCDRLSRRSGGIFHASLRWFRLRIGTAADAPGRRTSRGAHAVDQSCQFHGQVHLA